jgi:hypothetical protein
MKYNEYKFCKSLIRLLIKLFVIDHLKYQILEHTNPLLT